MTTQAFIPAHVDELRARWCCAEVWVDERGYTVCGGEKRHVRRVEGALIVTYLRCLICGALTKTMTYNMETAALTICGEEG